MQYQKFNPTIFHKLMFADRTASTTMATAVLRIQVRNVSGRWSIMIKFELLQDTFGCKVLTRFPLLKPHEPRCR